MPEIKDFPNDVALVDSDVLPGQRVDGTPLKATVARIKEAVNGAGGVDIVRGRVTANTQFRGLAPTGLENLNVDLNLDGSGRLAHTIDVWSGVPGRFASAANHAHYKMAVTNALGPGTGTAGERAQLIYNADADGKNVLSLHGYESELGLVNVANEESLDTTATTVGAAPSYSGTIKVRYTTAPSMALNQLVVFQVFSAVAGLQASIYGARVSQIPTLVSGRWEILLVVSGLDPNHWNAADAKDEPNLDGNWVVRTLSQAEIAGGAKVSLARDTAGPTDQLTATWSAAHNLLVGDNVVVWADPSLTGLTGLILGQFNSAAVTEVVNSNSAKIRIRNFRNQSLYSYSGTAGATSQWAVYPGTRDPHHEVMQPSNLITGWRDASGRIRRFAVGSCDVSPTADQSAAIGFDLPLVTASQIVRLGAGSNYVDIRESAVGRASAATVTAQTAGLICEGSSPAVITQTMAGQVIGTDPVSIWIRVRLPNNPPPVGLGRDLVFLSEGQHRIGMYIGQSGEVYSSVDNGSGTNLNTQVLAGLIATYGGRVVDFHVVRLGTTIDTYLNGVKIHTLTNAKAAASFTASALLRFGSSNPNQAFVGRYHKAVLFNRDLPPADVQDLIDFDIGMDDRAGSTVNLATNPGFETDTSGYSTIVTGTVSLTRITSDFRSGAACAEFSGTVNGDGFSTNVNTSAQGVRYRVRFWAKLISGNANITVTRGNASNGASVTLTGSWAQYEVVTDRLSGNATNLIRWNISGAAVFRIDDIEFYQLGALIDLDFSVGIGFQIPDRTPNRMHALATGGIRHLIPERRGQVRCRSTATGQLLVGGQAGALLPAGSRIASIVANVVGSGTVSVGTSSGGTQIVNAGSVSAGLNELTLATRLFAGATNLWATLTGPTQVDFTINYELID